MKENGQRVKILKSLLIAFSLYSRIPMPQFEWQEDEYGHAISFLPLVGLVIGAAEIGMWKLCLYMGAPVFVKAVALCLVPLVITGGFHLDGYMDVCDALSSYSGPERSLEIMKDPHIGAFAVIGLARFGLLFLTGAYLLVYGNGEAPVYMFALLFVFVRALCGVMSLVLPKAKKDGMLAVETGHGGSVDFTFLTFQAAASGVFIIYMNLTAGTIVFAALMCFCFYYAYLCKKKFGGVTGDTAGMFIVRGELLGLLVLAVYFLVV
jgi:adenosylcobinamide-GDP ribazoletransferase